MRRGLVLIALLATAQTGPQALSQTRLALEGCLGTVMRESLLERIPAEEFQARLASRCAAQEQAFRSAAIAADLATGLTRAQAEQSATLAVADMRDNAVQRYKDYLEPNT
jgi:hypothetical protein